VALDFVEVTFMDSTGLGQLVDWFKTLREGAAGKHLRAAALDQLRAPPRPTRPRSPAITRNRS
jgi:hypothetical protein